MEFENPHFQPQAALKKLVMDNGLTGLVNTANDLFNEIRRLDGSMQTLVYENYNKFIHATETIRLIKSKSTTLETDLADLKNSVDSLNTAYGKLDDALYYKFKEIKRLDALEHDLNKLNFLTQIPKILKAAIAEYEKNKASTAVLRDPVLEYVKSTDILEKYKNSPFLVSLYSEIVSYVVKIKALLRKALAVHKEPAKHRTILPATGADDQLFQKLQLLVALKEEPQELRQLFLKNMGRSLEHALVSLKNKWETVEQWPLALYSAYLAHHEEGQSIKEFATKWAPEEMKQEITPQSGAGLKFNSNDLIAELRGDGGQLVQFEKLGDEVQEHSAMWRMRKLSSQVFSQLLKVVSDFSSLFLSGEGGARDLGEFVKSVLKKYLEKVNSQVLGKQPLDCQIVAECLRLLWVDMDRLSNELPPELAGCLDAAHEATQQAVQGQLDLTMREVCEHVVSVLEDLGTFPEKEGEALIKATLGVGVSLEDEYGHVGQKAIEAVYNDIMARVVASLGALRVYSKIEVYLPSKLLAVSLAQSKFAQFFQLLGDLLLVRETVAQEAWLSKTARKRLHRMRTEGRNGMSLLMSVQLVLNIESTGLFKATHILREVLDAFSDPGAYHSLWDGFERHTLDTIHQSMRALAAQTLTEYSRFYGGQIQGLLEQHFWATPGWKLAPTGPRQISPAVFKIAETVTQVCEEMRLSLLFNVNLSARQRPGGGVPLARKQYQGLVFPSSKKRQSMQYEMERYLAKKLKVQDAVQFSATAVVQALAKVTLKTMYELARQSYLSNGGFNQLQADVLLLFCVVKALVTQDDHGMLNGLVGEVIMSATGRAAGHKNLEIGIGEQLANQAFAKLFRVPTEEEEYYSSEEEGDSEA